MKPKTPQPIAFSERCMGFIRLAPHYQNTRQKIFALQRPVVAALPTHITLFPGHIAAAEWWVQHASRLWRIFNEALGAHLYMHKQLDFSAKMSVRAYPTTISVYHQYIATASPPHLTLYFLVLREILESTVIFVLGEILMLGCRQCVTTTIPL